MLAGAMMGLCFAFMWLVTMYQLWFAPRPSVVVEREQRENRSMAVMRGAGSEKIS